MNGGKPPKPANLETPGLIYCPRRDGWTLAWRPRQDLVARGYPAKTWRLWPPSHLTPLPPAPTVEEWEAISAWCERYQVEMLLWANGGVSDDPASIFDGSVGSLIKLYQTDRDSPFRRLRWKSQQRYAQRLKIIEAALGNVRVNSITFRDIRRWYEEIAAPDEPGGPRHAPRAYDVIVQLKLLFRFGKLALPKSSGCADVVEIFEDPAMEFSGGQRRRKEYLTYERALLVCEEANRRGYRSIALAQAIMIECGVRQKDVIGEWVPRTEPGVTDIFDGPRKWLMGARWEEVDRNFVWRHRLSKSVKGSAAIMDSEAGTVEEFDLKAFPLVVAELQRIAKPADALDHCRSDFPASGAIIVDERSGRPWRTSEFRRFWRMCARAAGLPDTIQNRDSRPGAATEAELAGAAPDTVRRLLGHARGETTEIYRRGNREVRSNIAKLRAAKRTP